MAGQLFLLREPLQPDRAQANLRGLYIEDHHGGFPTDYKFMCILLPLHPGIKLGYLVNGC